jgi:hypothetical protein
VAPIAVRAPTAAMTSATMDRFEKWAPLGAGALFALPVLVAKFPPMADLPLHEASVGLLRHWGDPVFAPPSLYFVNLGHSNQLFSLATYALAWVLPIAWATKVVVAAAVAAIPLAAARFADHLNAPRWTALLVAPVGLGWLFFWGLIQNIIGIAALLAVLPTIDRFAASPTARGALRVCGAMVLLHFAHQAMQMIACVAVAYCSLGARFTVRSTLLRAVPVAFGLAVIYAAFRYSWHFAGPVHKGMADYVWHELGHKLVSMSGVLFGGYEPYVRHLMMVLACVPLGFALAVRLRRPWPRDLAARLRSWRFELFALSLVAVYLIAPANIKSTTLVYHRFLPPAWAIGAVALASGTRGLWRLLPRAICAAVPTASLLIGWPAFADSHRIYTDLARLLPRMDRGATVFAVNIGPDPEYRLWSPVVAMGYVVSEHGGRAEYDYTQSPISVVSQRPQKQWPDVVERTTSMLYMLRPQWDLQRFRYLLVLTPRPTLGIVAAMALRDDANLVASSGDWYLFESTHPQIPIDADEAEMTPPYPPSFRQRMAAASKELDAAQEKGASIPVPQTLLDRFDSAQISP